MPLFIVAPLFGGKSQRRDHVDALLSLKTQPTMYISDEAGRVA